MRPVANPCILTILHLHFWSIRRIWILSLKSERNHASVLQTKKCDQESYNYERKIKSVRWQHCSREKTSKEELNKINSIAFYRELSCFYHSTTCIIASHHFSLTKCHELCRLLLLIVLKYIDVTGSCFSIDRHAASHTNIQSQVRHFYFIDSERLTDSSYLDSGTAMCCQTAMADREISNEHGPYGNLIEPENCMSARVLG